MPPMFDVGFTVDAFAFVSCSGEWCTCMQVAKVCEQLEEIEELKGGFNIIGFSQGGQFARVRAKNTASHCCSSTALHVHG